MEAVLENPGRRGKAATEAQKSTSKQMPAPFLIKDFKANPPKSLGKQS